MLPGAAERRDASREQGLVWCDRFLVLKAGGIFSFHFFSLVELLSAGKKEKLSLSLPLSHPLPLSARSFFNASASHVRDG